jgi:hypothetical protein
MEEVGRLYEQFRTEKAFGWYAEPLEWRALLRKLYPIEWVSAHHRQADFTEEMLRAHARRKKDFDRELVNLKQQGC